MAFSAGEGSAVNIKAVDAAVGIVDVEQVGKWAFGDSSVK